MPQLVEAFSHGGSATSRDQETLPNIQHMSGFNQHMSLLTQVEKESAELEGPKMLVGGKAPTVSTEGTTKGWSSGDD